MSSLRAPLNGTKLHVGGLENDVVGAFHRTRRVHYALSIRTEGVPG